MLTHTSIFAALLLAVNARSVLDPSVTDANPLKIDFNAIESQPLAPNDISTTEYYSISQYNFLRNESWSLTIHPDTNDLIWLHQSQSKPFVDAARKRNVEKSVADKTPVKRGAANNIGFRFASYDFLGTINCFAPVDRKLNQCVQHGLGAVARMVALNYLVVEDSNPHYYPKMNIYNDANCQAFVTSLILHKSACVALNLFSVLPFNQYDDSGL